MGGGGALRPWRPLAVHLYPRQYLAGTGNPSGFGNCPLWLARYGSSPPPIPSGFTNYAIWQFSQSGSIDGITGKVDENHLAMSFAEFRSRYSL